MAKKEKPTSNFYVTNSGSGIKELPVEVIKANRPYFKRLLEKAKQRYKDNIQKNKKNLRKILSNDVLTLTEIEIILKKARDEGRIEVTSDDIERYLK